jgi:hypothetical protein
MTDPIQSANAEPWAGSPSKPSLPFHPVDPAAAAQRSTRAQAQAEARERRRACCYGHYWAVVTVLFGVSAVAGLANGDAWGLFALLLAGGTGWYSRYLYRGGSFRFLIIPIPWI